MDLASECPRHVLCFQQHIILFKLVDEKRCYLVRIAWQLGTRRLWVEAHAYGIMQVDALQRVWISFVPSLTALLHHGTSVLLRLEDTKLLRWVDLAL